MNPWIRKLRTATLLVVGVAGSAATLAAPDLCTAAPLPPPASRTGYWEEKIKIVDEAVEQVGGPAHAREIQVPFCSSVGLMPKRTWCMAQNQTDTTYNQCRLGQTTGCVDGDYFVIDGGYDVNSLTWCIKATNQHTGKTRVVKYVAEF
jgi:hypothetical protein